MRKSRTFRGREKNSKIRIREPRRRISLLRGGRERRREESSKKKKTKKKTLDRESPWSLGRGDFSSPPGGGETVKEVLR